MSTSSMPTLGSPSKIITKPPTPLATTVTRGENGQIFLPATVQRTYKYEPIDDDYEYSGDSEEMSHYTELGQPPRKRERLTHLSPEEKMFRRKMKNRIAAQTARDRKKALMVDLEETVRRLEEENDTLLCENSKLRDEHSSLVEENERLKQQLSVQPQQPQQQQLVSSGRENQNASRRGLAFGPAESINVPLPKEQAKTGLKLTWLVASALIQLCSKYCAKSSLEEEEKLRHKLEQLKENDSLTLEDILRQSPRELVEKLWSVIRCSEMIPKKPP